MTISDHSLRFAYLCPDKIGGTCAKHKDIHKYIYYTDGHDRDKIYHMGSEEDSGDRYLKSRHSEEQMQQVTITLSDSRFA